MEKKRCFGAALYLVLWKEGQPAWSKPGVKGLGGKGGTQHQKGYVDSRSRGNEREMSSYKSGSKTSNKGAPGLTEKEDRLVKRVGLLE